MRMPYIAAPTAGMAVPRLYWSRYAPEWLRDRADEFKRWPDGADRWYIFDNTAAGHAISNALELRALLLEGMSF